MQREKRFIQHANVSTYDHSLHVAEMSLTLAHLFRFKLDEESLVRGALLHDFFLYDWHDKTAMPKAHAYLHPLIAYDNIEKNIIQSHMFPIGIVMPKYRESWMVVMADKICTVSEVTSHLRLRIAILLLKQFS